MARQKRTLDGKPTPDQILAEQAHLEGRAGKAMYQEYPTVPVPK
jgi:hypothetical protein